MISTLKLLKHELNMAWKRWQMHRCRMPTGLADSGWALHGLVRSMKPKVCVEIGSAHGFSTCLIGLALHQNLKGHLWAVDPHVINHWSDDNPEDTFQILQRNLRRVGVNDRVSIIRKITTEAIDDLPNKIDFAFIDGDHSYEGAKQDWEIIAPRMNPFGVVVFHDTLWDRNADDPYYKMWRRDGMGVPSLMEELRDAGYPIVTLNQNWGLSMIQAIPDGESLAYLPPSE